MIQNLKETWLVNSTLTWGTWQILTRALKNVKYLHSNELLLTKQYNVWAKKVQRSYVWLHWRLMQNFKENWLSKMIWRIWQVFTRAHSKIQKLGLLLGSFIQIRKCMSLKFTEELRVMRMKNDAKFEEDMTC